MPDYVAAARANRAWLASRSRDFSGAEQNVRAALAFWQQSPLVYPFQWLALWPLIAVLLARGKEEDTWANIQALLDPMQQRLPDELYNALDGARQGMEKGDLRLARAQRDHAVEIARQMGYL
jgi:hypothetical protein